MVSRAPVDDTYGALVQAVAWSPRLCPTVWQIRISAHGGYGAAVISVESVRAIVARYARGR